MTFAVLQSRRPIEDRPALTGRLARRLALPVMLLVFLSIVLPARADVGATIIERCTHGQSLGGFSQQDYRRALQELPAEVEEYSDCANLIRRAQLAAAGGGGSGGAGGEGARALPLTPSERAALRGIPKTGAAPLRVGGRLISPGVVHASVASALSSLPSPVLAILAFMLACALLLAGRSIRNGVRAHRSG
ncbi:MAG: hypothetical protein E6F96_02540 [Actinobacteria bacterium]|nr:MAG: hypothetical protein E6F96_02540 [Actinomycetota bacterium]